MRNLFLIFIRYGGFLTFLALEALSFFLIIQFNDDQSRIYFHSVQQLTGYLDDQTREVNRYIKLREDRDSLAEENARLKTLLNYTKFDKPPKQDSLDHLKDSLMFFFINAEVVKQTLSTSNNYFTLNKGFKDGVKKRMGVLGLNGIVGIVRNVSENYCYAMSLKHSQVKISASLKKSNHFGSLTWQGGGSEVFLLEDIPKNAPLEKGDTVQTSGYSYHFPPEVLIGTIDTFFIEKGSSFYSAEVKLINDLAKTRFVYIVEAIDKEEQLSLEQDAND